MSMNRLPSNVVAFSDGNTTLYDRFINYYNFDRSRKNPNKDYPYEKYDENGEIMTFEVAREKVDEAFLDEIYRKAGFGEAPEGVLPASMATNPQFLWATFEVVNRIVDSVIPDVIDESIGIYTDIRNMGFGDTANFKIKSRDLFSVSKAGRAVRDAHIQREHSSNVTVPTSNHQVSVAVGMYQVLAGVESLADFTNKAILSIEAEITQDAYAAFEAAMNALASSAGDGQLRLVGYTQDGFMRIADKVGAWNQSRPVVVGTARALANVLPASGNYQFDLDSEYAKLGYMRTAFGFDLMALPQIANWKTEFGVSLAADRVWIISPGAGKLIKLVFEGSTIANISNYFDASDLRSVSTLNKSWGVAVVTSALAGQVTI